MRISRPLTIFAACIALATAVVALPPSAADAGAAGTTACKFVPVGDNGSGTRKTAAGDRHKTPFAMPANATTFTSPDGFGGRQYIVGPSNGHCVAHGGLDLDFNQQITLPGQRTPAFEQVFGAGGDYQLPYGCRYLPSIRRFARPASPPACTAPPPTEQIELLNTGMPTLPAALVRVEPNVSDPQLKTTGTDPVLAVVLAFDHGGDGVDPAYRAVTTSFADCRLNPATTAICIASLRTFVDEAIAFQRGSAGFKVTAGPGAKIRNAIARRPVGPAGLTARSRDRPV